MCQQVCYYKYLWCKSTMRENEISASMVKKSLKGGIYFVFWKKAEKRGGYNFFASFYTTAKRMTCHFTSPTLLIRINLCLKQGNEEFLKVTVDTKLLCLITRTRIESECLHHTSQTFYIVFCFCSLLTAYWLVRNTHLNKTCSLSHGERKRLDVDQLEENWWKNGRNMDLSEA